MMSHPVPRGRRSPASPASFKGAAWHERETHEMFGIDVTGFDDGSGYGLRPLLLPDGFEGHPAAQVVRAGGPGEQAVARRQGAGRGPRHGQAPTRRRVQAPGVPDPQWGPR